MTHYETLGVLASATPDEIKAAARRAASAAHPDREGGSTERMAEVNRAREVLLDPERRSRYDATGLDDQPATIEAKARDMLLQLFSAAIENSEGNWLHEVSKLIAQHRSNLLEAQSTAQTKRARCVRRTGKIKVRAGENLVQMLLDSQLRNIDAQLANVEEAMQINAAAAKMLSDYEGGEVEPPAPTYSAAFQADPYTMAANRQNNQGFFSSIFGGGQ